MEAVQMQRTWVEYTKSLFREGFLDAQFQQLQLLQDESNPDFVAEVVSLFFEDSERLLTGLEHLNCLLLIKSFELSFLAMADASSSLELKMTASLFAASVRNRTLKAGAADRGSWMVNSHGRTEFLSLSVQCILVLLHGRQSTSESCCLLINTTP
uniref:Histidine-containing phosphotransfer protein n=1 Tax=Salix viminalis TaxID=40686 RepID=A0A6N2N1E2_SALVM